MSRFRNLKSRRLLPSHHAFKLKLVDLINKDRLMDPSMFAWISAALLSTPARSASGDSRSVRTREAKDNALLLRVMRLFLEKSVILIFVEVKITQGVSAFCLFYRDHYWYR